MTKQLNFTLAVKVQVSDSIEESGSKVELFTFDMLSKDNGNIYHPITDNTLRLGETESFYYILSDNKVTTYDVIADATNPDPGGSTNTFDLENFYHSSFTPANILNDSVNNIFNTDKGIFIGNKTITGIDCMEYQVKSQSDALLSNPLLQQYMSRYTITRALDMSNYPDGFTYSIYLDKDHLLRQIDVEVSSLLNDMANSHMVNSFLLSYIFSNYDTSSVTIPDSYHS